MDTLETKHDLMSHHLLDIPDEDFHKHQKVIDKIFIGHISKYSEYTNICRILQIKPADEESFNKHLGIVL